MSGAAGAIIFPNFPAATNRNPGVFADLAPGAQNSQQNYRALIIGQITSAGIAPPNIPLICSGANDAVTQGGPGSMLALMAARYLEQDPFGEVWYLPLADDPSATAATLAFSVAGSSFGTGTIALYIAGQLVPVAVSSSMTMAQIQAAILADIAATSTVPVIAAAAAPVAIASATYASGVVTMTTSVPHGMPTGGPFTVTIAGMTPSAYNGVGLIAVSTGATTFTYALGSNPGSATAFGTVANLGGILLTAKNKGLAGNDIDVRYNYYGTRGGEALPANMTLPGILAGTGTQLAGGTQNPTALATALANLGTKKFNFICQPYNDTASRTAFQAFMNNTSGRWSWAQQTYGGGFGAYRGTFSALTTFGTSRNDPAMSTMGFNDAPEPSWIWAADITANCAASLRENPAVPLQYIVLGTLPPPMSEAFAFGQDNTLLYDGISTFTVSDSGQVITSRLITEYQTNTAGQPDTSYLDVETRFTLDYVLTYMRQQLLATYSRNILVSNATRVAAAGTAIVTPAMIKTTVINIYRYLESQGLVQNSDAFAQAVQVQIVASGVAGVYWPGDLANQLRAIGIEVAFQKT